MTLKEKKINIVGYGYVGQATAIGLKKLGYDNIFAYDLIKKENLYNSDIFKEIKFSEHNDYIDDINSIHIICVSDKSRKSGKQNMKDVSELLTFLNVENKKRHSENLIILRTTVVPNFLKKLEFDFYWVEFLREKNAILDFLNPEYFVVGRRYENKFPFERDFERKVHYCIPEEASHIKYLSNIWNSLRIAFVNEFGDNLIDERVNKKDVLDFFFKEKKYMKWGNAFGGHCLPKDSKAYSSQYKLKILRALIKSNEIHHKKYPNLESIY
mgnify:CR=1 FL=1